MRDIERFESGGNFRITKRIGSPPAIADFARLHLPDEDAKDLRSCKVSDCEVKLAQSNIERIQREVDWSNPDARERLDRIARETAMEFVTARPFSEATSSWPSIATRTVRRSWHRSSPR